MVIAICPMSEMFDTAREISDRYIRIHTPALNTESAIYVHIYTSLYYVDTVNSVSVHKFCSLFDCR